ncbi:DUF488 family protein [Corynebacteriaceae bacterium 7-707]
MFEWKARVMGKLEVARVYDVRGGGEGGAATFLVDRLWPRGVSKDSLPLTGWPRELTPSDQLRKDFHGGSLTWRQFGDAYRSELDRRHADGELDGVLTTLAGELGRRDVKLLFAGKDTEHTHALVLRDWLAGVLGEG